MFFYKPYYLEPQKGGDKAYVCCATLWPMEERSASRKSSSRHGNISPGVKAMKHALVLELMHFAEELADAEKLTSQKDRRGKAGKRHGEASSKA